MQVGADKCRSGRFQMQATTVNEWKQLPLIMGLINSCAIMGYTESSGLLAALFSLHTGNNHLTQLPRNGPDAAEPYLLMAVISTVDFLH